MCAPAVPHSFACAATRRHKHRRAIVRQDGGKLDITTLDVAARLHTEGVPATDIHLVAAEVERCIRFVGDDGDDVVVLHLHPWTVELIDRYGDKLRCLLMTTRGKVDAR